MNHSVISHRIRCISIIGGFLDETKFELADGLKYFIGARGAGKTTLPSSSATRWALCSATPNGPRPQPTTHAAGVVPHSERNRTKQVNHI